MKETFTTASESETEALGATLGKTIARGLVGLYGDLGVGKTAFSRGFIRARFPGISVSSHSFAVMNQYGESDAAIYHADLYRIDSYEDLESTGFLDLPENALILCEWAEKLPDDLIPEHKITFRIGNNPNERVITWESERC